MYRSPVERPNAPSSMAWATISCIRDSSPSVGARSAACITSRRMVLCPTSIPMFIPTPSACCLSRYSPTGHGEDPSGPPRAVVTPCRTWLSTPGSRGRGSRWACRSMNPGATTSPVASMTRAAAVASRGARDTRTMRPSRTPTSPGKPGAPVPSRMVPPVMRRSSGSGGSPQASTASVVSSRREVPSRRDGGGWAMWGSRGGRRPGRGPWDIAAPVGGRSSGGGEGPDGAYPSVAGRQAGTVPDS